MVERSALGLLSISFSLFIKVISKAAEFAQKKEEDTPEGVYFRGKLITPSRIP